MKLFITLVCCLAVPLIAHAENQGNPNKKKKQGQGQQQQGQVVKQGKHQGQGLGQGQGQGRRKGMNQGNLGQGQGQGQGQGLGQGKHKGKHQDNLAQGQGQGQGQDHLGKGKNKNLTDGQGKIARHETKHFKLANKPNPKIESMKFVEKRHIEGSEHWHGEKYVVFRDYHCEWHDRFWWHAHYPRVVLVLGGWYYFNAGYWFPAWGYDPGQAYYPYDGPIYAHRGLSPDQVVANVQSALQEQGYYHGEVDGLLGPLTRAALADYQRDKGLETTAAVDEPTLDSLGMS
jgi:hypothetical protein